MKLTRKDISLFPTQHGFLFLGILVAMLLGSVNYNNNAGFILVFLLGSMALISLSLSYKNLLGITVATGHPSPVFAGQTAFFPVDIKAPENCGLALSLSVDAKGPDRVSSPAQGSLSVEIPVETSSRGYHVPENIRLESVFPFGLFRLYAGIPNTKGILVYPAPASGTIAAGHAGTRQEGDEDSRLRGPDDFQGLSPYVPGSPVGHISWKTLSKGKGLFIKDFSQDTGQDLLFDPDLVRGKDIEIRLSRLCRAILDAEKNGLNYGLKLGSSHHRKPDSGRSHMHSCLKALALFREAP